MRPVEKRAPAIKRVLVIFPGALGDLMCLMPALAAISRRHRDASIELMARFELARLVAGRSVVARAHSIDAREVGELFSDEEEEKGRRFFGEFDRIYSFFASDDPRFRARLSAATDADVSFHPFRPDGDGHVSEGYLRAIGEDASPIDARLEPTPDDLAAASRVLAESKCDGSNLIVIFPGSGSPAKNWPVDKFLKVSVMLASESGILRSADSALNDTSASSADTALDDTDGGDERHSCVVILGPAETSMEPIFREAGVTVLKDLELPTVAAIARLATAFVGNDSGVSHLAAAVGASGVAIFGPTDPARWRPLGSGQIIILRGEPIDSVEVRDVAEAISKFVEQRLT
jgi:lipopolysaccharide heptosyltransferase III